MNRLKEIAAELVKEAVRSDPNEERRRRNAEIIRRSIDPTFNERERKAALRATR